MRYLLATIFACAISFITYAAADTTVTVIVSNAQMQAGADSFYVPTMFVNWSDELPVQVKPTYEMPGKQNVTVFHIANWNTDIAAKTIVNFQLQNDYFSNNCAQPASYFCTDKTCTTLKITMQFQQQAVCAR